ncbi:MAG: hypothetical protein Q8K00_02515 [Syntrophales bacterium]|nr:hypothetical protein [Syntrophales bacterium]
MVYTFACPVPCHQVIKVYANTDDDAINNIIIAGALSCRNMANRKYCEKSRRDMPSLPEERLREIVRFSMEAEPVDGTHMTMCEKMTNTLEGSGYTAGNV